MANAGWWSRLTGRAAAPEEFSSPAQALAWARELFAQGELPRVHDGLRRACARWPGEGPLHEALGAACLNLGDAPGAIAAYERARAIGGDAAACLNQLGMACLTSGDQMRALALFMEAITLDPGHADARANVGWLNFALGRVPETFHHLRLWLALVLPKQGEALQGSLPATRRALPDVTVACIDCAYHDLAVHALRRSLAHVDFGEALLFTDREVQAEGVRTVLIPPVRSSADYSNFVIHELGKHVRTDFVLIVQYDGMVINGQAWDDAFFGYDYIGSKIYLNDDAQAGGLRENFVVGNGGFSLRSRKLMDALRQAPFDQYDAHRSAWAEDLAICVHFHERLEREHGIRIAPGDIADRFSVDASLPGADTFGYHNIVQTARLVDHDFVADAPPGQRIMPIRLRTGTAFGPFRIDTAVPLGCSAEMSAQIRQELAASSG